MNIMGDPKAGSCTSQARRTEQGTSMTAKVGRVLRQGDDDPQESGTDVARSVGNVFRPERQEQEVAGGWALLCCLPT